MQNLNGIIMTENANDNGATTLRVIKFNSTEIKKVYWSVVEVAAMFHVAPSMIRYWCEYFNIKVYKKRKNLAQLTEKDIEQIQLIYKLIKVEGYTFWGAERQLKILKNEQR